MGDHACPKCGYVFPPFDDGPCPRCPHVEAKAQREQEATEAIEAQRKRMILATILDKCGCNNDLARTVAEKYEWRPYAIELYIRRWVTCPTCREWISRKAQTCPHCGHQKPSGPLFFVGFEF